jgi:hypothetical protein
MDLNSIRRKGNWSRWELWMRRWYRWSNLGRCNYYVQVPLIMTWFKFCVYDCNIVMQQLIHTRITLHASSYINFCRFLEHVFIHSGGKRFHLLELGCGAGMLLISILFRILMLSASSTGLCGLTSAAALEGHWESVTISLTDRHIDLCCQNLSNTGLFRDVHVSCFELTWGACNSGGFSLFSPRIVS